MNFVKKAAAAAAVVAMAAAPAAAFIACDDVLAPTLDTTETGIVGQNLVVTVHTPDNYDSLTLDWNRAATYLAGDSCSVGLTNTGGTWAIDAGSNADSFWALEATATCTGTATNHRTFVFTRNLADSFNGCQFTNAIDEVFDNTITYTTRETQDAVFGEGIVRTDQTTKSIQITLPEATSVTSTDLDAFNSAIEFGLLSSTTIDLNGDEVLATFTTSVQYPYQLDGSPAVSDNSDDWNIATDAVSTLGPDCGAEDKICLQTWQFPISKIDADACAVDGTYTITFQIGCHANFLGTCDGNTQNNKALEFTLTSADFCPKVVEVATITPTMTLHNSETRRTNGDTDDNLIFGTMLYTRTNFAVEGGIQLTGSRLLDVTIDNACSNCGGVGNDGVVPVVTAGSLVLSTIDFASEAAPGAAATTTPNDYDFEYRLTTGSVIFDNNQATGNVAQTVSATFVLDYDDAVNQKRQRILRVPITLAGVSVGAQSSATFGASNTGSATSTSQATVLGVSQGTVIAVGVALGAVAIIAVGAAVGIKRRSAAASADASAKKIQSSSSSAALELESAAQPAVGTGDLRTVQTAYDATQA